MTIFTVLLKTRAGLARVKVEARDIAAARDIARLQWGAAVRDVTISPATH